MNMVYWIGGGLVAMIVAARLWFYVVEGLKLAALFKNPANSQAFENGENKYALWGTMLIAMSAWALVGGELVRTNLAPEWTQWAAGIVGGLAGYFLGLSSYWHKIHAGVSRQIAAEQTAAAAPSGGGAHGLFNSDGEQVAGAGFTPPQDDDDFAFSGDRFADVEPQEQSAKEKALWALAEDPRTSEGERQAAMKQLQKHPSPRQITHRR
jgi:hypothetical protein